MTDWTKLLADPRLPPDDKRKIEAALGIVPAQSGSLDVTPAPGTDFTHPTNRQEVERAIGSLASQDQVMTPAAIREEIKRQRGERFAAPPKPKPAYPAGPAVSAQPVPVAPRAPSPPVVARPQPAPVARPLPPPPGVAPVQAPQVHKGAAIPKLAAPAKPVAPPPPPPTFTEPHREVVIPQAPVAGPAVSAEPAPQAPADLTPGALDAAALGVRGATEAAGAAGRWAFDNLTMTGEGLQALKELQAGASIEQVAFNHPLLALGVSGGPPGSLGSGVRIPKIGRLADDLGAGGMGVRPAETLTDAERIAAEGVTDAERIVPQAEGGMGGAPPPPAIPTAAAVPEPPQRPEWQRAGADPFAGVKAGSPTEKAIQAALDRGDMTYEAGTNLSGAMKWRYKGGDLYDTPLQALKASRRAAGMQAADSRTMNAWGDRLAARAERDQELAQMDPEMIAYDLDKRVDEATEEYVKALEDMEVRPDFYATPDGEAYILGLEQNLDQLAKARDKFRAYRGTGAETIGGGGVPPRPPAAPSAAAPDDIPPTPAQGQAMGGVSAGVVEGPVTPLDMRPRPPIGREALELVDPTLWQRIDKMNIPEDHKDNIRRLIAEDVVENGFIKEVETHQSIRDDARAMVGDEILPHLRPFVAGQTAIPRKVRFKMREDVNALNAQAVVARSRAAEARRTGSLPADQIDALEARADNAERSAKAMLDILIPMRSDDGRNLAYHKMVSEQSFDVEYWMSRAQRAAGGALAEGDRQALGAILADASAIQARQQAMIAAKEAGNVTEAERLATEILDITGRKQAVEGNVRRLEGTLEQANNAIDALHQRRAELAVKIEEMRARAPAAQAKIHEAQRELADLARAEREMAGRLAEIAKLKSQLGPKMERQQAALAKLEPLLAVLQAQTDDLAEKLRGTKAALKWERKQRESLKRKIDTANRRLDDIEGANFAADEELGNLRRQISEKMRDLDKTTPLDTILLLRKAGLLTGIKTHVRNLSGNASMQLLEEVARIPASVADIAMSAITGERTVQGANLGAMVRAGREAATRGVKEAGEIMRMGATAQDMAKIDYPKEANTGSRILDVYLRTVFRSLSAEDRIFRVYAIERSLQAQADIAARAKPRADRQAVRDQLVKDAWEGRNEAMMARAQADAEFATFNNENPIDQGIRRFKSVGPKTAAAVDLVMPFVKTPTNVVLRVFDYTLIGAIDDTAALARAIVTRSLTPERQKLIAEQLGRGATGTALVMMGAWMYQSGHLTGTRQREKGGAGRDEVIGRTPVSVRPELNVAGWQVFDGKKWYPIQPLAPASTLLAVGATLARDDLTLDSFVNAILQTVSDMPFLTGMKSVVQDLESPMTMLPRAAQSITGSFVPTLLSDIASTQDPYVRRATSIPEALAARGVGGRANAPIRLGPMGEVIPNPGYGEGSILGIINAMTNPYKGREAREAYSSLAEALRDLDVSITRPQPTISFQRDGVAQKVRLTPEEENQMLLDTGVKAYPRIKAKLNAQAKAPLPADPEKRQIALDKRKETIEKAIEKARAAARRKAKQQVMESTRGKP